MKPIITKSITPIADGVSITSHRRLYGRRTEVKVFGIPVYRKDNLSFDNIGIPVDKGEVEMLEP